MAGTLALNTVQLGDSLTATQNLVIRTNVDGTFTLARGNAGATTQDILTIDANGLVSMPQGRQLTLATALATTSGSAIDFTSIPSWVKKVTVSIFGVSASGSDSPALQLGTGGVVDTTHYKTESILIGGTHIGSTAAFYFGVNGGGAGNTYHGSITFTKHSGNTWVASGCVGVLDGNTGVVVIGGSVALTGALDMIRLSIGGGQTFDAGSVNIMYEG